MAFALNRYTMELLRNGGGTAAPNVSRQNFCVQGNFYENFFKKLFSDDCKLSNLARKVIKNFGGNGGFRRFCRRFFKVSYCTYLKGDGNKL